MTASEPIDSKPTQTKRSGSGKSLIDFLRAIRFTRRSKTSNKMPEQHFAGLSSSLKRKAQDEDDCIRSGN